MSQSHIPLELRRRVAEQARHRCGSTAHRYSKRGRRGWRLAGIRPKIEVCKLYGFTDEEIAIVEGRAA